METNIQVFKNSSYEVRSFVDDKGAYHFVAQDVCKYLVIANYRDALTRLDDDEKGVVLTDTPGGKQEMLTVTEAGLYRLIGSSKKPEAKEFQRWVYHEVLPSIRQTGQYQVKSLSPLEILEQQVAVMRAHEIKLAEHTQQISSNIQAIDTLSETQSKQAARLTRLETRTKNVPVEYAPVNITERNRMQKRSGALCIQAQKIFPSPIGVLQKQLQESLCDAFQDQFGVSLLAELETAKLWYNYDYCVHKAEDPKYKPEDGLTPAKIRGLSLYAIISTNPSWVRFFDQFVNNCSAGFQSQIDPDTGEKIEEEEE